MSLDEDLLFLVDQIKEEVGVDVSFGKRDLPAQRRPIIEMVPEANGLLVTNNTTAVTLSLPLTINIKVDDKDELRAFSIMQKTITTLNNIKPESGWKLGSKNPNGTTSTVFTQTYDESTFALSMPFNIINQY